MKKLSITLLTLFWVSLFGFSTASAAGLGFGITGSWYTIEADGTETDSNDSGTESSDRTGEAENAVQIASFYTEVVLDGGIAIGYEMTPGAADVSDNVRTREDTEKSVTDTATETTTTRQFKLRQK